METPPIRNILEITAIHHSEGYVMRYNIRVETIRSAFSLQIGSLQASSSGGIINGIAVRV